MAKRKNDEYKKFKNRELEWIHKDGDSCVCFKDTKGTRFRTAGRGETEDEAIVALYDNTIECGR